MSSVPRNNKPPKGSMSQFFFFFFFFVFFLIDLYLSKYIHYVHIYKNVSSLSGLVVDLLGSHDRP